MIKINHPDGVALIPQVRYDLWPPDHVMMLHFVGSGRQEVNLKNIFSHVTVWMAERRFIRVYAWRGIYYEGGKRGRVDQVPLRDRHIWEALIDRYKIVENNSGVLVVQSQKRHDGKALKKIGLRSVT